VEDYASQCACTDNNRLNLGISLVRANIDRCPVEEFPIDIRQTRPAPLDPWGQAPDAFALVGEIEAG
jgi:hypothetical protein